jgi:hypothetical protein
MWPSSVLGHEFAVDEERAADAGAQGQQDDDAATSLSGTETHLCQPGGVGVVEDDTWRFQPFAEQRPGVGADPGRIDVGRRADNAVANHAGDGDADRGRAAQSVNQLGDSVGNPFRGGRLRGVQARSVRGQFAPFHIDQRGLHSAAADVDPDHPCLAHQRTIPTGRARYRVTSGWCVRSTS